MLGEPDTTTTSADNGAQSGEVQGDEFQPIASTQSQSEESEARKGVHSVDASEHNGTVQGKTAAHRDGTIQKKARIRPTQGVQGVKEHFIGPILNKPAVLLL